MSSAFCALFTFLRCRPFSLWGPSYCRRWSSSRSRRTSECASQCHNSRPSLDSLLEVAIWCKDPICSLSPLIPLKSPPILRLNKWSRDLYLLFYDTFWLWRAFQRIGQWTEEVLALSLWRCSALCRLTASKSHRLPPCQVRSVSHASHRGTFVSRFTTWLASWCSDGNRYPTRRRQTGMSTLVLHTKS